MNFILVGIYILAMVWFGVLIGLGEINWTHGILGISGYLCALINLHYLEEIKRINR